MTFSQATDWSASPGACCAHRRALRLGVFALIPPALGREKCASMSGDAQQCAVKCAFFSREAFNSKNSSPRQKSLWTHFLASILRGLSRVISTQLDLSRVISTDFIYTRARGQICAEMSGGLTPATAKRILKPRWLLLSYEDFTQFI